MSLIKPRSTLFDLFLSDPFFSSLERNLPNTNTGNVPAVNTFRVGDNIPFEVSVPGFNKEELGVSIDGNVLTVRGTPEIDTNERQGFVRTEFETSSFTRTFNLPADVDPDTLSARYCNGILTVKISLADTSKSLTINIE